MAQEFTPPPPADTHDKVPNYLIPAIISAICCLPLGIVSIIFAAQVNGKVASGDIAGAMNASKKAKMSNHPVFKEMAPPAPYQPRWRAWLTGFDAAFKLAGEAGIGSADLSHNTGGLAGGLDYQFGPDLLAGFAIGGSSSNFAVRDRITSGHLEGAHFGGYGVKTWGSLYAGGR